MRVRQSLPFSLKRSSGWAPSAGTASTFHRVVRNFLGFCRREGWGLPARPSRCRRRGSRFSGRRPSPRPRSCSSWGPPVPPRDRFLLEFMLRTGLRRSEVANVTVDDIISGADGAYVRVRQGKGAKDRIVPLDTGGSRFSKRLAGYLRTVRPPDARDRHLFLSGRRDRSAASGNRWTPRASRWCCGASGSTPACTCTPISSATPSPPAPSLPASTAWWPRGGWTGEMT